jgi:hypothetical protein
MITRPTQRGRNRYDWWRAHHGFPGHPKWRAVARGAQVPVSVAFHVVACLLDTASRATPRGSIGDFKPFDCAGIVDVSVDKVDAVLKVLRDIKWIDGHMLADWDGRQPQREDQGAAERKAKSRSATHLGRDGPAVTHAMRDKTPSHALAAGQMSESSNVTKIAAPDRDKNTSITSSEFVAAREEEKKLDGELATALPAGALRSPSRGAPLVASESLKRSVAAKLAPADGLDIPPFLRRA